MTRFATIAIPITMMSGWAGIFDSRFERRFALVEHDRPGPPACDNSPNHPRTDRWCCCSTNRAVPDGSLWLRCARSSALGRRGCTTGRTRVFSRPDPLRVRRTVKPEVSRGTRLDVARRDPVRAGDDPRPALSTTTRSRGISFNMLHARDLARIQMKIYCPVEDEVISRGDTVKGFEYVPGQYVVITDEDLEAVPLKTVRAIGVELFTAANPDNAAVRFVKGAYYLEPSDRAQGLLPPARGPGRQVAHRHLQGRDQGSARSSVRSIPSAPRCS